MDTSEDIEEGQTRKQSFSEVSGYDMSSNSICHLTTLQHTLTSA